MPGDRIVGLRRQGQHIEVHTIDCLNLVSGVDADWIDLSWGGDSDGATARIRAILYNRPGTLADMAGIFSHHKANIVNLKLTNRDQPFHTYESDLEVHDVGHLMQIIMALRASESVARAERI